MVRKIAQNLDNMISSNFTDEASQVLRVKSTNEAGSGMWQKETSLLKNHAVLLPRPEADPGTMPVASEHTHTPGKPHKTYLQSGRDTIQRGGYYRFDDIGRTRIFNRCFDTHYKAV